MQSFRSQFAAPARSRGFSRIELLVMTAIIAALILLSVPGILHVREAARHRQSNNNLRNLGRAFVIQKFDKIKNDSLADLAGANLGANNDDHVDSQLMLAATVAISAAFTAMIAALFIRFVVRFFNRRADRLTPGTHNEQEGIASLDDWFCPPSSSPI